MKTMLSVGVRLRAGLTPEGNVAAEAMGEVIRNTTSQLTVADLDALVA